MEAMKPFWSKTSSGDDEVRYRKDFQTTRNRKAMRWLLANCVDSGMSRKDVDAAVGEPGEFEENSGWLKRGKNTYRVDDKAYRYGPDDQGQVVYLFYRDDKLINFERERFADSSR